MKTMLQSSSWQILLSCTRSNSDKLEQLGVVMDSRVHTTRLKNRLLSEPPDLQAHAEGKDILLSFKKDVGPTLRKSCDHDSDAMHLVRAAQVVRQEMFDTTFSFDGSFQANCQHDAVPPSLLALVNMILDGAVKAHPKQKTQIDRDLFSLRNFSHAS